MATIGDGQVTIQVSGSGGLAVDGFFTRAVFNEQPAVGGTITGDGALTITGLANRTAYFIFAQVRDSSGCFGPASRVLLLTPRASGDSDLDVIKIEIRSEMQQVSGIGRIHLRRRHTVFWDKLYERHKKDFRLNNWEIDRPARAQNLSSIQGSAGVEPFFHDLHTVHIRGHMALNDEKNTDKIFQKLVDDITLRIQLNNRLTGAVLIPAQLQAPIITHEMFGSIFCHFAQLTYQAEVRVGG